MRRGTPRAIALVMTAALICPGTMSLTAFAAEAEAEEGELIFAQCDEDSFINIHDKASKKGEVTAKIYNNGSAVVEEVAGKKNNWYKISSGNAEGYVKAKYFATGEEAEAIAEEVAYRELTVRPSSLNVHADTNDDSEILDTIDHEGKLEMLAYAGDWLEVALSDGESGYVEAQYVDLTTYYPTAETLEEEAARLAAEAETESEEETETGEPETQPEETEEAAPVTEKSAETEESQSYDVEPESEEIPSYVSEEAIVEKEPEETAYVEEEPEPEEVIEEEPEEEVYEEEIIEEEVYEEEVYEEEVYEEPSYEEPVSSATGQEIADYACSFIGNPYVWGGTSLTNGADCSGFVQSVFAHFGISLARTADAQAGCGTAVSLSEIQPGDLLFYCISTDTTDDADDEDEDGDEVVSTGYISHVAIYIGGGTIVHAANSRRGITTDSAYFATPAAAVRCW